MASFTSVTSTAKHLLKIIRLPKHTPIHDYLLLEEALLRESPHSYVILLDGTDQEYVISGSGNKPHEWLNQSFLHQNQKQFPVVKRYTGGGSVVVSPDTIFVSFVLSKLAVPDRTQLFPKPIMKWSEYVYKPVFGENFRLEEFDYVWMHDTSTTIKNGSNSVLHPFDNNQNLPNYSSNSSNMTKAEKLDSQIKELNEDLFELGFQFSEEEESAIKMKKFGGNAQYVTGGRKQRFCHHTSFLWDFKSESMNNCLKHPNRKPDYRHDRKHDDFLIKLKDMGIFDTREAFFQKLENRLWELYETDWKENIEIVYEDAEEQSEYLQKNQYIGTRFINPLTGEAILNPFTDISTPVPFESV